MLVKGATDIVQLQVGHCFPTSWKYNHYAKTRFWRNNYVFITLCVCWVLYPSTIFNKQSGACKMWRHPDIYDTKHIISQALTVSMHSVYGNRLPMADNIRNRLSTLVCSMIKLPTSITIISIYSLWSRCNFNESFLLAALLHQTPLRWYQTYPIIP